MESFGSSKKNLDFENYIFLQKYGVDHKYNGFRLV